MTGSGYIMLHRKITEWEWYQDANTMRLFIHLLIHANFEPKRWEGMLINRGQLIVSVKKLANQIKLTERKIRTAISKLEKTNVIATKTTNRFTLVTINKYDEYNNINSKKGQTERQEISHSSDNQATTIKKYKEMKEEINISTPEFDSFWDTYDKKVDLVKCLEAWKKIPESEIKKILEHVPKYVATKPDKQYRKDPLNYLNGKNWLDDIICPDSSTTFSNKTMDGRIKLAV